MSKRRTNKMSNKERVIDGKAIVLDEGTPEPPVDDQKDQNQTGSAPNPAPEAADDEDDEDEEGFFKRLWRKTPKPVKVGLGLAAAAGVGFLLGGAVMNHGSGSDDEDNDQEDDGMLYIEDSDDEPLEIGSYEEPSNSYTETPAPETVVEE